ncbi:MAG: hypothetical protein KIH67_004215 [Candidatus Moranbacteria bacterium]|nr:hypothetical protein [Candidatus Moranbacteria bacterium]
MATQQQPPRRQTNGEVPVNFLMLTQQDRLADIGNNNTIQGGDRGFGNAGGARNHVNFTAGAGAIT